MVARTAGRKGRPWRRARERTIAEHGDTCWICGHPGAGDVDHLVARSQGGGIDPANLRPAHGAFSRCPVCGRCCNQVRGAGRRVVPALVANTSRTW